MFTVCPRWAPSPSYRGHEIGPVLDMVGAAAPLHSRRGGGRGQAREGRGGKDVCGQSLVASPDVVEVWCIDR